jgi:hypothetical protein
VHSTSESSGIYCRVFKSMSTPRRLWTSYSPPWEPEISQVHSSSFSRVKSDLKSRADVMKVGSKVICLWESRGRSVSIVSGYGLDRAIDVRSSAGAKDFSSSLCVQTGSGAHPASCRMGTGGPFPRGKTLPGRDADYWPHIVPRSWMSRSYTSSPPSASMAWSGTALICLRI